MANFIANATKNAHGQFAAKAKQAGMSTAAYANKMANSPTASPKTKKQANLAKTLMSFHKKGGSKPRVGGNPFIKAASK